jgi:hypothetical protein
MPDPRHREPDAVLGLCRECHQPSFIDTSPPSLSAAVTQASEHDRLPKVKPRGEATRILACWCLRVPEPEATGG